jgi:2'-5' RNA ligase
MSIVFFTLYFDRTLEGQIYDFGTLLADQGIDTNGLTQHRPHITIAAYEVLDVALYQAELAQFAVTRTQFPIRVHYVGVFPEASVVFLAPQMTAALFTLHQQLTTYFADVGRVPLRYENLFTDHWIPHCTLAVGLESEHLARAITVCQQQWQPLTGIVEGVGLLVHPETVDRYQYSFLPR